MDAKEIGRKLRELRGNKSVKTVAEENGISTSAVSMYETGARIPKDEVKIRLSQYFNIPVGVLFFAENVHN